MIDVMEFKKMGKRLAKIRKKKGFTQEKLAQTLGVHWTTIAKIEAGVRRPSLDLLARIVEHLDISYDYLLGLTDDPRPCEEKFNLLNYLPSELKNAPKALRELARQLLEWADKIEKGIGGNANEKTK